MKNQSVVRWVSFQTFFANQLQLFNLARTGDYLWRYTGLSISKIGFDEKFTLFSKSSEEFASSCCLWKYAFNSFLRCAKIIVSFLQIFCEYKLFNKALVTYYGLSQWHGCKQGSWIVCLICFSIWKQHEKPRDYFLS